MGTDGRIASQGGLSKALAHDKKLAAEIAKEEEAADRAEHTVDESDPVAEAPVKSDGKLIVAEEISEGHVGWPARVYTSFERCKRTTDAMSQ